MKILVTGGGGFLGKAIIKALIKRGDQVRSVARGNYPELNQMGVESCQGDLADKEIADKVVQGIDAIFHVAAKAGPWGEYQDFYRSNVVATQNLLTACQENQVNYFIYTGSPSAVHNGRDINGKNESIPYPTHFKAYYPQTKAKAEQIVLTANSGELLTVSLRPHLIWGPGDNHLLPRFIDRARKGRLKFPKLKSEKLIDHIYIENAVQAHLLALDNLLNAKTCAGKAYFISQGDPITVNKIINNLLMAAGESPVDKFVNANVIKLAGYVIEFVYRLFNIKSEPLMTRFIAEQLTTSHYFDISAAKNDFGYEPTISTEEGLKLLKQNWNRSTV